jgi:serine protease Do
VIDEQSQVGTRAAVVKQVYRNSPAAQAGIRAGDQLVGVNGKAVDSYQQLLRKVTMLAPQTQVKLTLLREGESQDVVVKLTARPAQEVLSALSSAGNLGDFGLVLRDVSPEVAAPLGLEPYAGVLVSGVVPRSAAARAGLQPGDVVTEVNRRKVKDVGAVKGALERGTGAAVLLRIQRGERQQYVALEP